MKKFTRNFSIALLFISLFYVAHIIYFTQNGILVGTYVVENNNHELQVVKLSKSTYGKYMGLKEGDRIIEISGKTPTEENIKGQYLAKAENMKILRGYHKINLNNKEFISLNSSYSFFIYIIPCILFALSLLCIFYIYKVNRVKDTYSAYILIIFLLCTSIAYLSAGGVTRGYEINRYINLFTFLNVPVLYFHFLYQYFKELKLKFSSGYVVSTLYILPVINIIIEIFEKHFAFQVVTNINLATFFLEMMVVYTAIIFYGVVYRKKDHFYLLKVLLISNTIAFFPLQYFILYLRCCSDSIFILL